MPDTETIMGLKVTRQPVDRCLDGIAAEVETGKKKIVLACANPHSLATAHRDRAFYNALKEADVLVPDGAGIVMASRLLSGKIRQRITGTDVFRGLSMRLNNKNRYKVFFLGSTQRNLDLICRKFALEFPRMEITGVFSPPFKPEFSGKDSQAMIDAVNRAKPHLLWVGMTAPKQEKWIQRCRDRLDVNFIGAVGAVFDFYVGSVKRSPPWFLDHGLEWLPRLIQQPERLWNRTMVSAPKFLYYVLRQRFGWM